MCVWGQGGGGGGWSGRIPGYSKGVNNEENLVLFNAYIAHKYTYTAITITARKLTGVDGSIQRHFKHILVSFLLDDTQLGTSAIMIIDEQIY